MWVSYRVFQYGVVDRWEDPLEPLVLVKLPLVLRRESGGSMEQSHSKFGYPTVAWECHSQAFCNPSTPVELYTRQIFRVRCPLLFDGEGGKSSWYSDGNSHPSTHQKFCLISSARPILWHICWQFILDDEVRIRQPVLDSNCSYEDT